MANIILKSIFAEAWHKVRGSKKTFFLSFLVLVVLEVLYFYLTKQFNHSGHPHFNGSEILASFVFCFFINPLLTGFYMLGVKRARGEALQVKQAFAYYPKILPLFVVQIIFTLILWATLLCISVPAVLLLVAAHFEIPHVLVTLLTVSIGAVYVLLAYTFMAILNFSWIQIVDQNQPIWQAFKNSFKVVFANFKTIFLIQSTILLLEIAGAALLGIGLLWVLPFSYIMTGVLYCILFTKS